MTEIHLQFLCAHYRLYGNAPVLTSLVCSGYWHIIPHVQKKQESGEDAAAVVDNPMKPKEESEEESEEKSN